MLRKACLIVAVRSCYVARQLFVLTRGSRVRSQSLASRSARFAAKEVLSYGVRHQQTRFCSQHVVNGTPRDRVEQSGAMEACWAAANRPEVRRSKLRSAKNLLKFFLLPCQLHFNRDHPKYLSCVPLAQRIARWTSNPKVLGSIPRWDEYSVR